MEDNEILTLVSALKRKFGGTCSKFSGAATVEIVKRALKNRGILSSRPGVFIRGIPIEIDLLIPREGAVPEYGLVYEAEDVLAVLEIKNHGSFGEGTISRIRQGFQRIHKLNKKIYCAYVTLMERKGYKWAITESNLGFPGYTLFWHSGAGANYRAESSGDWERLVDDISKIVQNTLG